MASPLWVFNVRAFLGQINFWTDRQLRRAAPTAGWEERPSWNGSYDMFYPGAARLYDLCLRVYDGDQLKRGQWHEAYDGRGIRFSKPQKATAFIRERLQGTSIE